MSNTLTSKVSGRMSSRGWAIALGIGAVVLAAILLVVYLDRYRDRVERRERSDARAAGEPADSGRHAGLAHREPGDVHVDDAAAEGSRRRRDRRIRRISAVARPSPTSSPAPSSPPRRSRRAIRRPSTRRSRVRERAFAISIDGVHGSQLAGDAWRLGRRLHVRRQATVKLFRPNVKVLTIPTIPGPAGGGNLILRIDTGEAATWLYAADNTQLIFVLRPVVGAKPTKPSQADASTLLR